MSTSDIYNYVKVDDRVVTSGQPTASQLKAAAAEGFQAVINLVPPDSQNALPQEAEKVEAAGMAYHHIPVSWQNPQESDFEKFTATMKQVSGQKALIHCAANYRATAFYSLYALQELKWTAEQADQLMRHFWKPGEYPVWDKFIQRLRENITARSLI
jgi:uncharacterized protein (TIGR01244 family)